MPDTPVPLSILRALADETVKRLALAPQIEHPGESGRAREQMLIAFIKQLIPSSFGVSTGFVVDAVGGKSKQVDVVVYRIDYAPVFEIGGVKHFLVESTVAVLEVKAAIDSNADLIQALDNIASVKALDRTNRGRNKVVMDRVWIEGQYAQREQHTDQVFGAIVTEKSLARGFPEALLAWFEAHPRREWPNIYVDVQQFVAAYGWAQPIDDDRELPIVGTEAMRAESLVVSRPNDPNAQPSLLVLGVELIDWFRRVPTIDFSSHDYLWRGDRQHETWDLPDTDKAESDK